jgi:adenylate cyclase
MKIPTFRFSYLALVIAVLAITIGLRHADPFFVRALRLLAFDTLHHLEPASFDPDLPVRVVDVDEESLAKLGQWPWPRSILRELLTDLTAKGAAAVAFDFLFIEPDRTSPGARQKTAQVSGAPLPDESQLSHDAAFAAALAATPSVLATALLDRTTNAFQGKSGYAVAGDDPRPFLVAFPGASSNLAELDQAARGIGAITWLPDRDQVVRRIPLVFRVHEQYVPSLAAEALRVAQGATTYVLKSSNASGETAFGRSTGLNHVKIGNVEIPTDAAGAVFLKFRHFTKTTYIPAWKVLAGEMPDGEVAGKIVLVGTSATGLLDLRATPLDPAVPGVEVHAQLIEQMIKGEFLHRPDYAVALEEFVILALGLMLAVILPRVSARIAIAIGTATILVVVAGGWASFRFGGLLVDPSYTALSLGLLTAAVTSYTYQNVEAQRGAIRDAFSRYLAPAVVEELIAHPEKLELGGEERELTLMFSDVRNFTTISQDLSPSELTRFINELLSPLTEIILSNRGTIDKYMGDAIMAFWNAPLDDPDHAANACRAARQMIAKMDELNEAWRERAIALNRSHQTVRIGVGINTGRCCVGNLGSAIRFDYSAIGDEVNISSRFEGLCKAYGLTNIIGDNTIAKTVDLSVLELDIVQVKGRTRATRLYTMLPSLGVEQVKLDQLNTKHAEFLQAYRGQHWDRGLALIEECRSIGVPSMEVCYEMFRSRVELLRTTALPADWDGSFAMSEK